MKRRRIVIICVFSAIVLALLAYHFREPNEPKYHGKTVSAWLKVLNNVQGSDDGTKTREALDAIRNIGPQAIPYIFDQIRADDLSSKRHYPSIFFKLPRPLLKFILRPRRSVPGDTASAALRIFGVEAKPYLLMGMQDTNATVRVWAVNALTLLKHDSIIDCMPELTESLRDPDPNVRLFAASGISQFGSNALPAVSNLISLVEMSGAGYTEKQAGDIAVHVLGAIGPGAESALPALRPSLENPDLYERFTAATTIWEISGDVSNTLPLLIDALSQDRDGVSLLAIPYIGEMGSDAKAAVPDMLKMLEEKRVANQSYSAYAVLVELTNALLNIDPAAATAAGIHN